MKTKLIAMILAAGAMLGALADMHNKVQLWAGGPYWADRNIGASKPEDYGLYFWWGDTTGHSLSEKTFSFSFDSSNTPTEDKSIPSLQSEGWIVSKDGTYVLAPTHDAAHVQWGGAWRMPTYQELSALISNCDWSWITRNGVNGYAVRGRGVYSSNSIFLPCAGGGYGTSFRHAGSGGLYWSSVPNSDSNFLACGLRLDSDCRYNTAFIGSRRLCGFSVRPVQGFTKATAATSSGMQGRTGMAKAGTHSKTLNAAKEQPNFHASNSSAKRTAKRGAAQYIVIDLSRGANAARYPVRFSSEGPDLVSDTCRTTELWLRLIPPGTFTMGSPETELGRGCYEAQHSVTISKRFYLGVFEVTQKQYELVMGSNPSSTGYFAATCTGDTRPVACVSYDALRGSNIGANWPSDGQVDADSFFGKLRARTSLRLDLPTEAMWEYACRAGTTTALNNGKDLTDTMECAEMAEVGRYGYNIFDGKGGYSPGYTTKVGSYTPNAWGLYDMHGNVGELCLDWWQDNLGTEAVTDPKGATSGHCRIVRGGCWSRSNGSSGHASGCRSAARSNDCNSRLTGPDQTSYDWGFRVSVLPAN